MAENKLEPNGMGGGAAATAGLIRPSIGNALPYFVSLAVFPLVINASIRGGWWIAAPYLFLLIPDLFDAMFGVEERNMDPRKTRDGDLFVYKLSLWLWAVLWPSTLIFTLWQLLASDHLSALESVFMVVVLSVVAQASFITGHELLHRRSVIERRIGEFILASVSYPHYASEHVYVHHALACTPGDPGSAPKGVSLWKYLLQHCGPEAAPQLPGTYVQMAGIAVFPKKWFKTMDPLVDKWRKHFYPQIDDYPVADAREAVDAILNWSNDKTFQIAVHRIHGNLSQAEAGTALSNVAEASVAAALSAVEEDFAVERVQGGVAAVALGGLGRRESALGLNLDMLFVYQGSGEKDLGTLCHSFDGALRALSSDSVLFAPASQKPASHSVLELAELPNYGKEQLGQELPKLTNARCIFTSGDSSIANRFEQALSQDLPRGDAG